MVQIIGIAKPILDMPDPTQILSIEEPWIKATSNYTR